MTLELFKATDFRCLEAAEVQLDPMANLITGANAAGKTSLLEAIAYLGRAKSFRGASTNNLIRYGQKEFVVFGRIRDGVRGRAAGVRNSAAGLEITIDGESGAKTAELADVLPLQIIDPDVHELVAGTPERRRRYLDWVAFHVEQGYLALWRRYRRSLRQRNAALKAPGTGGADLDSWDREFAELAEALSEARTRAFEIACPVLEETAGELLGESIAFEYRRGWSTEETLLSVLQAGRDRDLGLGSTQAGPQRADLRLKMDNRQAKRLVSRGQQKLLAGGMIVAATDIAQTALERPLLLLLDDPAAELDRDSLRRLMEAVNDLGCQVIATALEPDPSIFATAPALFHVEQGALHATR